MASCNALIFADSLVTVLTALNELVSARTIPRILVGVPDAMVIDSGVGARFLAANLDSEPDDVIVSVTVRSLAASLVALSVMVMVSVRILTTFVTPAFDAVTASMMETV